MIEVELDCGCSFQAGSLTPAEEEAGWTFCPIHNRYTKIVKTQRITSLRPLVKEDM